MATLLDREIHEQPAVLARLLDRDGPVAHSLAGEVRRRQIGLVVIAARGTSDNAARYANYLLAAHNRLVVSLATPSLFTIYGLAPQFGNALVLGISQSGRSPDIVAVLAEGRRQGALTAAITNDPTSDLGQVADHVLDLHAGEERSVAATKTYTAELAAIALLSVALSGRADLEADLRKVPDQVAATLAMPNQIAEAAWLRRQMASCVVIGRGYNYATAFELALKLKELTYTPVEPYSSADFLHGPMALLQPGFPVIVIAASGAMLPELQTFMRALREREAETWAISDDEAALAMGRVRLRTPAGVPEWLSPMTSIIPGQLLALNLALAKGHDPDHPRGLRKVTETL